MTIDYYVDQEDLAELLAGRIDPETPLVEQVQVKVSCQGDIAVQPFYPDANTHGVAWLLLAPGPPGEPGRKINGEVDEGPRMLQEQHGVLIGATDPRSLTVIIDALTALRDRLENGPPKTMEQEICETIAEKAGEDIADQEDKAALLAIEEALKPDHPVGAAVGEAISKDLDQAMIDALYDDEPQEN